MPRCQDPAARTRDALRLRRLRRLLGLSQRELAAEFYVAPSAIALWETAARTMPGPAVRLLELFEEELRMTNRTDNERAVLKGLTTSRTGRTVKLAVGAVGSVGELAGSALSGILRTEDARGPMRDLAQQAVTRRLAKTFSELKGLPMKVGQMFSYLDFAMPPAAREAFIALQSASTPMAFDRVVDVFLEEFGETPAQLFAEFEPLPFAAASIGQVHRARLRDGGAVAVKVQYPGVADAIESDLKNTALIDRLLTLLYPNQDRNALGAELKERMAEECDYAIEARNQQHFAQLMRDERRVWVPAVDMERSSKRVLVSELVDGQSFAEFCATATQQDRNWAGETIFRVAWGSILKHHVFNADPHPGNYLFADGKLVLLDFGCVKRYSPSFVEGWKAMARSILEDDRQAMMRALHQLEFLRGDERRFNYDYHRQMMQVLYEPFLMDRPFRFTSDYVSRTWRMMIVDNPNKGVMNMPRDWIFNNRLQWGLCAVLALLQSEVNFREVMLRLLYEPGESWPPPVL